MRADHLTDVLSVRNIQRSINLVQNVDGGGFEHEQRQDEGQGQQGSLTTGEFRKRLLPDAIESHLQSNYSTNDVTD